MSGNPVAVKRRKLSARAAAHRELRLAEELLSRQYKNVLSVLDAGLDARSDTYFIVMPKAEQSLQDMMDSRPRFPIEDEEVVRVLCEIAHGLDEVPGVVHRDLKPANILFHAGTWNA